MKVLPFTIPVPADSTIILQEERQAYFYPHLHRHAEVQVTWVVNGEGTLLAGSSMHPFTGGDVFVLGANQPHLFKSSPEYFLEGSAKLIHALTIFFDPKGKLKSLFDLTEMTAVKSFANCWENGFKVPPAAATGLIATMQNIRQASGAAQLALFVGMLNSFTVMEGVEMLASVGSTQALSDPEGLRIASVYNYIMQNYQRQISLEEAASVAHLTPNAFCRYFKKHTRATFVTFVNKVRVNEACKMLVSGNAYNIADVAYTCGFSSLTNFNYVFRNTKGCSPREFVSGYLR